MTPRELLALTPQHVSHDVRRVLRELPEVDKEVIVDTDDSLEWREYAYRDFDGRRIWLLASIHFRGRAALIVQRAGREGDDHHERIIVDARAYVDLVNYVDTLPRKWPGDSIRSAELDVDDDRLTQFYGHSLAEIRQDDESADGCGAETTEQCVLHVYTVDYPEDLAGYCPYIVAHYSAREAEELVQRTDESEVPPHAELIEPADYVKIGMLDEDNKPTTLAASLVEAPVRHPCIIAGGEE